MNCKELLPPMQPSQQAFEQQTRYDSATQTFTAHCAVCGQEKKQRATWLRSRKKTLLNLRWELLFCSSCGKWVCEDCFFIDDGKGNGIGICTACALAQGISGLTSAQFEEAWLDIQRPIQKRLEAARRATQKNSQNKP
ncbi:MAG: hypothetical protein BWX97_01187 [Firmicutes bacterium ADurb.Bin146]|nr:MAG: hypothetical protein BWX97_01187 [Firmicutes bacterium ADurb.Bin146]